MPTRKTPTPRRSGGTRSTKAAADTTRSSRANSAARKMAGAATTSVVRPQVVTRSKYTADGSPRPKKRR